MEHVPLVKIAGPAAGAPPAVAGRGHELISVGVLGLIDAAGRYQAVDSACRSTRSPAAACTARCSTALRDLDWAPRSLRSCAATSTAPSARLRHALGREPTDARDCRGAGRVAAGLRASARASCAALELGAVRPLDAPATDGIGCSTWRSIPTKGPYAQLERKELRRHLAEAIGELPERERQILALYYEEELTLAEIGEVIGVGESRVSQLRSLAVPRLRAQPA